MAYTNIWNENKLTGGEPANTLAALINSVRVDLQDRLQDIFAIPDFTVDPLRPYGLKLTDAQDSVINLGDNGGTPRSLVVKNKAGSTTFITLGANLALTTTSGITPLSVIGVTAFSRFSRNEAAFGGALIQFDRSGIVAGYIGMDSSDNLTIQRGADSVVAATINRTNGAITTSASSADALTVSVTGAVLCSNFKQLTASTDFVSRWTFQNGIFWDIRGIASDGSLNFSYNGGGTANLRLLNSGTTAVQDLTCTTLEPSGAITSSATGSLFARSGASTAAQYVDLSNTTGRLLLGVESSAGGTLIAASTGYATCLTSVGATVLQLGTNQVVALTISTSQVVTLANKLIVNQSADSNANLVGQFSSGATAFPIGVFAGETGTFFGVASNGQRGAIATLSYGGISGRFYGAASGGTPASRSAIAPGTTIASFNAVGATGATTWGVATSGFQILANDNFTPTVQGTKAQITVIRTGATSSLTAITFTDTLADIFTSAQFEQGATILGAPLLVGTAVATGSAAGDIVLPNLNSIRAVNAAGSTTLQLLSVDASNQTTLNLNSAKLAFANALTATTATVGGNTIPAGCAGFLIVVIGGNTNKIPFFAN